MSVQICLHCGKKFSRDDGFNNEEMITCTDCLKKHFKQNDIIIKLLKKIIKGVKKMLKKIKQYPIIYVLMIK